MDKLTESDIHFAKTVITESKGAGYLVKTKSGKTGRTYHHENVINGKYQVHCIDGSKVLCSCENLIITGFID